MRNLLLCGWLALPIGAWAYHEGPGQDQVARDDVAVLMDDAFAAFEDESFAEAVDIYGRALELVPDDDIALIRELRLELDKARMEAEQLPEAREDLLALVEELAADADADAPANRQLLAEARQALASAQYYMTWLMRLEGLSREVWEPEIEAARQNYRLLAEQSDGEARERHEKDLESAVRLARMELQDLQGLPLPSQ